MPPSASTVDTSASSASNSTMKSVSIQARASSTWEEESNYRNRLHPRADMESENGKTMVRQAPTPDDKRRKLFSCRNSNPLLAKLPPHRNVPRTQEITLLRYPGYTLRYFSMAVYSALPKRWPWSMRATAVVAVSIASILTLHHHGKGGWLDSGDSTNVQSACIWMQSAVAETLFWIGCGVLSTIGLGSGVQTGALFLFPHVCRLALAWSKQQQEPLAPSLGALLWSVAIPGFWSGGGSAAGELVPFVLARLIRRSGKDPFALLNAELPSPSKKPAEKRETASTMSSSDSQASFSSTESTTPAAADDYAGDSSSTSRWTPQLLLSNTRATMENQLTTNAFWKIFTLAVVPNALFDLAGIVCGASSDVSWWEFFLATWFAKALIRTPGQTCGLALAVVAIASPRSLSIDDKTTIAADTIKNSFIQKTNDIPPASSTAFSVHSYFERWGKMALAKFVGDDDFAPDDADATETASSYFTFDAIKGLWTIMTMAFFAFFIISTIEQIAQHYVRSHPKLKEYHEESDKSKTA